MVVISQPPDLSGLQVFHTTDPLLSNGPVLVFYGPSPTPNATSSVSSRVQCHVFTAAGFQSYPKLIVSPGSTLYSAVNCLPREDQGDEICRALAFGILKYFTELSEVAKNAWMQQSLSLGTRDRGELNLWGDIHAADLVHRMAPLEDLAEVIRQIETALPVQSVSNLDIDLVVPAGSISQTAKSQEAPRMNDWNEEDETSRYGQFGPIIKMFGDTAFLPTSKIRRAPSRPTALNRSATFTRLQRENMRREMCELVNTEKRYVEKLSDLINNVAVSFKDKAQQISAASPSPDHNALETLFPTSLNTMLLVNTGFLESLQTLFGETESTASNDTSIDVNGSAPSGAIDMTGTLAFANLLLEWFPQFSECYTDYILAHSQFGPFLKTFAVDSQSTFAQRIRETGEQRLMSMLIEPVQRLPRYSLYIDNIIKHLPIRHPALRLFLKAKDIISEICSQDGSSSHVSKLARIKQLIPSWPSTFSPQGRFILAVDAIELRPPFDKSTLGNNSQEFLFLLFASDIVLLKKSGDSSMLARSFMTEVESTDTLTLVDGSGLIFSHWTQLSDVNFSETGSDCLVRWIPSKSDTIKSHDTGIRTFLLKGAYEGRASRWTKEFVKARVESRFTEAERDSEAWEARFLEQERHGLGLFTAIFEDGQNQYSSSRGESSSVRLVMSHSKEATKSFKAGQEGVEIVASVSPKGEGFYWLEIEAMNEKGTRDLTTETDFLPILTKRLGNLLQMRNQMRNPTLTVYLLQHHSSILNSLSLAAEETLSHGEADVQSKAPPSPVKLLSNLFGSRSVKTFGSAKGQKSSTPTLGKIPSFLPPGRSNMFSSPVQPQKENVQKSMSTLLGDNSKELPAGPVPLLEQTISCYLLALRARKGNVIGAVVARRGMSDEAAVNELYNALLEDPENHEKAAQASVDHLFAAFEKFLKVAWRDTLGPVIPSSTLSALQTKMEILNSFDYDEYAEKKLSEIAPQNRKAFGDIIRLLAHVLDGMRSDGDRGTLTAAFAEIVVCDGDPHAFIPMFDRLVEDHEVLSPERPISQGDSSGFASMASSITRSTKTGSISSKASSLTKRLGFGSLRRENSRTQTPGLVPSLKLGNKKPLPPEPTLEKSGLFRTKSIDLANHLTALRRPGSRDRPAMLGAFNGSRPGTAHSNDQTELTTSSKENSPLKRPARLEKKRRSSLSDLASLQTPGASPFWTASASKQVEGILMPSPNGISPVRGLMYDTPSRTMSARPVSPNRKENIAPRFQASPTIKEAEVVDNYISQPVSADPSHNREQPSSHGSYFQKGILSERISSGNTPLPLNISPHKVNEHDSPVKPIDRPGSPKKLRMQNPAKLRERLQTHQQAIEGANSTLQAELEKIGEELAAMNARPPPPPTPPPKSDLPSPSKQTTHKPQPPAEAFNLNTRLKALESKLTHLTRNLADRSTALETDLASSLQVSQSRVRTLDADLQLACAENEAIYARLNDETMKVFEQVRAGKGVEELKRCLAESLADAAAWRGEAARLKRENGALRALG